MPDPESPDGELNLKPKAIIVLGGILATENIQAGEEFWAVHSYPDPRPLFDSDHIIYEPRPCPSPRVFSFGEPSGASDLNNIRASDLLPENEPMAHDMTVLMNCIDCMRELHDGDMAAVAQFQEIMLDGQAILTNRPKYLLCEECADGQR